MDALGSQFETSTQKGPFMAMLIPRVRGGMQQGGMQQISDIILILESELELELHGMSQVPLEHDINTAVNGCSTYTQKGPFTAMLISCSRGTYLNGLKVEFIPGLESVFLAGINSKSGKTPKSINTSTKSYFWLLFVIKICFKKSTEYLSKMSE